MRAQKRMALKHYNLFIPHIVLLCGYIYGYFASCIVMFVLGFNMLLCPFVFCPHPNLAFINIIIMRLTEFVCVSSCCYGSIEEKKIPSVGLARLVATKSLAVI